MPRLIWYMAAPYGGNPANLARARRWHEFLQAELPEHAVIAPWLDSCEAEEGVDGGREAGIERMCGIIRTLCDGVILVGGRISEGMALEAAAARNVWDRTSLGEEPPT